MEFLQENSKGELNTGKGRPEIKAIISNTDIKRTATEAVHSHKVIFFYENF